MQCANIFRSIATAITALAASTCGAHLAVAQVEHPFGAVPETTDAKPSVDPQYGLLSAWPEAHFRSPLFPPRFEIPVLNRWVHLPRFRHGDPDDPGRHIGLGEPLVGTSWRNRPFHAGWLWGTLYGDPLIPGRVDQGEGTLGGYRLGWDFDHYWGTEARIAFSHVRLDDGPGGTTRTGATQLWDAHLLYYPWGDSRWRPFTSVGLGQANFRFRDDRGQAINDSVFAFPVGGGIKYLYRKWLALRFSVMDNIAVGAHNVATQHNVSVTGGVEIRLGGSRTSYYPYSADMYLW